MTKLEHSGANADTEKLEEEIAILGKELAEKKGNDAELIKREVSALWEEVAKKKREFKSAVQDAVNKIRKESGFQPEIEEAKQEGARLTMEVRAAAERAEQDVQAAQVEYENIDLKEAPEKSAVNQRHYFSKADMDAIRSEIERRAANGGAQEKTANSGEELEIGA